MKKTTVIVDVGGIVCDHDHEEGLYVMKVVPVGGDDEEEFQPVEESLMDELIEVVQTRFEAMEDEEFAECRGSGRDRG